MISLFSAIPCVAYLFIYLQLYLIYIAPACRGFKLRLCPPRGKQATVEDGYVQVEPCGCIAVMQRVVTVGDLSCCTKHVQRGKAQPSLRLGKGIGCLLLARLSGPATERELTPLLVLLAALCAPVTEIVHHGWSYGGQLQSGVLLLVFVYALMRKLPSDFDNVSPYSAVPPQSR